MRTPQALAVVTRRWPKARVTRSLAYRLGARMGAGPWDGRVLTGGPIALDLRDYGHRSIYFFGQIEPHITGLIRRRFQSGWTMLDVGANAGYHSVLCSDLKAARIAAFEPNPHLRPLLERTAARHPVITVEGVAVGDAPGQAVLQLSVDPGNTGLSTLGQKWADADTVTVPVITLDDYCGERGIEPDFIKIDVEGHEERVVAGMAALIERRVPRIVVCELTSRRSDPLAVIARFRDAGYHVNGLSREGDLIALEGANRVDACFTRAAS